MILTLPALGAVAGLIAGSFLATLVLRWPRGEGLGGRSACDRCGTVIASRDLVPLASFLLLRGRCRACAAPVDQTHPAIEVTCMLVGASALWLAPDADGLSAAMIGWLLVALAALDLRHFWLPDVLTAAVAMVAALSAWAVAVPGSIDRLIGGIAGFASLWAIGALYRRLRGRDGLGGGDPKLFGAIGLWLGWQALPFVLLGASTLGLGAALLLAARGAAVTTTTRLPLGTGLAIAAFAVWVLSRAALLPL